MSIIFNFGTKSKGIGSVNRIPKFQKEELLQTYYYWKYLGHSDKDSKTQTLSKYVFLPDIYDKYKNNLEKLIDKNKDLIKKHLEANRSMINTTLMKL